MGLQFAGLYIYGCASSSNSSYNVKNTLNLSLGVKQPDKLGWVLKDKTRRLFSCKKFLHTPLSPLFRGEKLQSPLYQEGPGVCFRFLY